MADDRDNGPEAPVPDACSFCAGRLKFVTYIPPVEVRGPGHRVYRCEACARVATFWATPQQR